ncbi:MAG: PilZ domain-containing protein [Rhodospirillales bacterium]|nr:PilZ domain-containing protein [Rhodospirillales bacterium]
MSGGLQLSDNRQHQRKSVCFAASVKINGQAVAAEIKDISAGGAKVEVEQSIGQNSAITLTIERFGDFDGEITWSRDMIIGVKFSEDPAAMAEVAYAMALYGPI